MTNFDLRHIGALNQSGKTNENLHYNYRPLWNTADTPTYCRVAQKSMTDSSLRHARLRGQGPGQLKRYVWNRIDH